ncbi:MAG: hypothetical protein V1846_00270 [Candidatus Komeilibacteria bacterium]
MLLRNTKLTVTAVTEQQVTLQSELKQTVTIARDFVEALKVGDVVYLSIDSQPLQTPAAKDILNEIING